MNILANVTYTLLNDYRDIVDVFSQKINGDTYFSTTLMSDIDKDNFNINDFDMVINFFNDENDILDDYFFLFEEAKRNDKLNNFVSYYKKKESYDNEAVYYAKKDANKYRKHRFVEYQDINEVIFDLMVHAKLYFDADINVHHGKLRFKNYYVLELGEVRFLANCPVIAKFYHKLCVARDEELTLVNKANIDDDEILLSIEKVHTYIDTMCIDFDRHLEYAIMLYKEIVYSFRNSKIDVLDYIFAKEYFEIGHWSSIASCFNRECYKRLFDSQDVDFYDISSILKLIIFSMAFGEDNVFVQEIIGKVFKRGKELELLNGKDEFFHFNAHYFADKINSDDSDFARMISYIELVEKGILEPKRSNIFKAYTTIADYYIDKGEIDKALGYAVSSLDYTCREVDVVRLCKILFSIYRINADGDKEKEYIAMASKYIDIMSTGYHDDYADFAIAVMSAHRKEDIDKEWCDAVIERALDCKYLNKESYYYLYLKKMFDFDNGMTDDERLTGLKFITNEMVANFYIRPTVTYVGIYNSLLVLGKLFEDMGDGKNAATCYKRAYRYLSLLENISEDTNEKIAYVQYKIGDIAIDMDSAKSYRQLAQAERRMYQYIRKTSKYVEFYGALLKTINDRYLSDNRKKVGVMIAQNHLSKLIDCCGVNELYFKDTAKYCRKMAESFRDAGLNDYVDDYLQLADNYDKICKEKNLD